MWRMRIFMQKIVLSAKLIISSQEPREQLFDILVDDNELCRWLENLSYQNDVGLCPRCDFEPLSMSRYVAHLNDYHELSFSEIADDPFVREAKIPIKMILKEERENE